MKEKRGDKERRSSRRVKKTFYVQCRPFDTTAAWVSAVVQDISEAGIKIYIMREFSVGEVLDIKISTFLRPERLNILGTVVSCKESGGSGVMWVMRVSFTKISEVDRVILRKLIQIFSQGLLKRGER